MLQLLYRFSNSQSITSKLLKWRLVHLFKFKMVHVHILHYYSYHMSFVIAYNGTLYMQYNRVQHTFRIKCCLKYMKLLRILCKCEDFYELCKHNYYPKKINNYNTTINCTILLPKKACKCDLIFQNEKYGFKKISIPTLWGATEILRCSRV